MCGVFHTLILLVAGLFAAVSSLCMRVARACVTVAWSVSSACLCSWHLSYVGFVGVCGVLECAVRFGAVLVRFVLCVFVCRLWLSALLGFWGRGDFWSCAALSALAECVPGYRVSASGWLCVGGPWDR